jgi:hypothetical protein
MTGPLVAVPWAVDRCRLLHYIACVEPEVSMPLLQKPLFTSKVSSFQWACARVSASHQVLFLPCCLYFLRAKWSGFEFRTVARTVCCCCTWNENRRNMWWNTSENSFWLHVLWMASQQCIYVSSLLSTSCCVSVCIMCKHLFKWKLTCCNLHWEYTSRSRDSALCIAQDEHKWFLALACVTV